MTNRPIRLPATLVMFVGLLFAVLAPFAGAREKVLHAFDGHDGNEPFGTLISGPDGRLYGTTCCTVFHLSPEAKGKWTEKALYSVTGSLAGVISDAAGNLYGTTEAGGTRGRGAIFQLSPSANGTWTKHVLHTFSGKDGANPFAGLVSDNAGHFYGTTFTGTNKCGEVFQLTQHQNGHWTFRILHAFSGNDGCGPSSALVFDVAGNLYGTASSGGTSPGCGPSGCGVVFELSPQSGNSWNYQSIYNFSGIDGAVPRAALTLDAAGNLHGTTWQGGSGLGTVFQLSPGTNGQWTESVLHAFAGPDGAYPYASLTIDSGGNLYGTTTAGGTLTCGESGCGTVFELTPSGGGWEETVLGAFSDLSDGGYPYAGVRLDAKGNLYGATTAGGKFNGHCRTGCGIVFEINRNGK